MGVGRVVRSEEPAFRVDGGGDDAQVLGAPPGAEALCPYTCLLGGPTPKAKTGQIIKILMPGPLAAGNCACAREGMYGMYVCVAVQEEALRGRACTAFSASACFLHKGPRPLPKVSLCSEPCNPPAPGLPQVPACLPQPEEAAPPTQLQAHRIMLRSLTDEGLGAAQRPVALACKRLGVGSVVQLVFGP